MYRPVFYILKGNIEPNFDQRYFRSMVSLDRWVADFLLTQPSSGTWRHMTACMHMCAGASNHHAAQNAGSGDDQVRWTALLGRPSRLVPASDSRHPLRAAITFQIATAIAEGGLCNKATEDSQAKRYLRNI